MILDPYRPLLTEYQLGLHYALVGATSLDALPRADALLNLNTGEHTRRLERDQAIWESAGARHSLRLRARGPLEGIAAAAALFRDELEALAGDAAQVEGTLLATGMHPWMRADQAESWPHGPSEPERAMDRVFGAQRHGWGNQQTLILSLSFESEFEFERLFAALRFAMPLMPALAASSPFAEGALGPAASCRLAARRDYFGSGPECNDSLVPASYSCRDAHRAELLGPLQRFLDSQVPGAGLQPLDLCGHGLKVDFDRGLIHIFMLDMQECLQADLAVCAAVAAITQLLMREAAMPHGEMQSWPCPRLAELLEGSLQDAERFVLRDSDYLRAFEFPEGHACRISELLQFLLEDRIDSDFGVQETWPALSQIVSLGSLSSRLVASLPERWTDEDLFKTYRRQALCLRSDSVFGAND